MDIDIDFFGIEKHTAVLFRLSHAQETHRGFVPSITRTNTHTVALPPRDGELAQQAQERARLAGARAVLRPGGGSRAKLDCRKGSVTPDHASMLLGRLSEVHSLHLELRCSLRLVCAESVECH